MMDPRYVHTIVTHKQPHFDEAVAIFLLQVYGAPVFHGVQEAKVIFWNAGSSTPDGRSAAEWEAEGYLLVGVGGGRFDEHPSRSADRKQKECAATLVAKYLGIYNEPALKVLLDYTYRTDSTAVNLPGADKNLVIFGIANLAKMINRYAANGDDQKALDWMIMAVEAQYASQMEFFAARQEFAEKGIVTVVEVEGFQQPLKVSAIVSDNAQMAPMLRSREGNQSAIVIQQNSRGQVQIHTNTAYYKGLTIYEVVRLIRVAEIITKTPEPVLPEWNDLTKEHAPESVEEWFFMHSGQMLLNGSLTNPDVKPTSLPLSLIINLVVAGLKRSNSHSCGAVCNCESVEKVCSELCATILGLIS